MPEFMDVHRSMKGVTSEQLKEAHQADLDIQDDEGVNFEQAWADPESGMVFCLSEAPAPMLCGGFTNGRVTRPTTFTRFQSKLRFPHPGTGG
jgi:hypothetical protein